MNFIEYSVPSIVYRYPICLYCAQTIFETKCYAFYSRTLWPCRLVMQYFHTAPESSQVVCSPTLICFKKLIIRRADEKKRLRNTYKNKIFKWYRSATLNNLKLVNEISIQISSFKTGHGIINELPAAPPATTDAWMPWSSAVTAGSSSPGATTS